MAIYALGEQVPRIHATAYVHPDAVVIGSVRIGPEASIWPGAVLRGDYGRIDIGARTSIQDGSVLHTTEKWFTFVGEDSVVGHNVHAEGCRIGNRCLIGSGSVVLNRARIHDDSVVGAGAVVSEGTEVPEGHLAIGVPARYRPAPDDLADWISGAVDIYRHAAKRYGAELRRID